TGGRGVDVVFECATSVQTQLEATRVAAIGGCVVLVGIPPEDRFELQHSVARRKGLTVKFARRMRAVYPRALALAARVALDLRALATHRFPLEASAAAFELAAAQADGVIKAVVEW
ncbi:MAG TPA: alcohol dehydrogenase, partial [Armatimonadetes bacterium]|nr:alcohol dehydrogenase [Armatimonadota bacterium]